MKKTPLGSISVLTVTYADRINLLERVCERCFASPYVADIYVVSNGSRSNLKSLIDRWGDRIKLIELDRNYGSAVGYSRGIVEALAGGCPYILLLDDDNAPAGDCIDRLWKELDETIAKVGKHQAGVVAPREFHRPEILAGAAPSSVYPPSSCFFGFSLSHKLLRKPILKLLGKSRQPPGLTAVTVPFGPYGGIMAARETFESIGLPKENLVLYADDIEYSYRITEGGGLFRVVFGAKIEDLDGRYSMMIEEKSVFSRMLKAPSKFRLYYITRNQIWFERHRTCKNYLMYRLNRAIFLTFLKSKARKLGCMENYDIFMMAVLDGEAERLGVHERFPLP